MTGSYERKIRCIRRKKIRILQKELPLLAQLIPINQLMINEIYEMRDNRDWIQK